VKRRSPWLTFAACALAGASCLVRPAQAAVNLEQALAAAKSEITARAAGADYAIELIKAVRKSGQLSHYVVTTYPELRSKEDPSSPVALAIDATGRVTDTNLNHIRRPVRTPNSK
jgi:hypothetical protein